MKPFEIFRTGRHTPMNGDALQFAEGDLAAMAATYDPAKHHAPIVVGHPKVDAPAYGWIDGLAVRGDRLVATPARVDTDFAELVRTGKFGKVSASFYRPDAAGNPVPGSYYLRHVGFLGAQPPAVKGLKPVEFSDDGSETIEFADWPQALSIGVTARLFRNIRDWVIAQAGLDQANQVLPDWDIETLSQAASDLQDSAAGQPMPAFSDPDPVKPEDQSMTDETARSAELDQRAQELAAREAAFAEQEAAAATRRREQRAQEDDAFVQSVVKAGRLPIGLAATATALFADLGDGALSFADGDETRQTTPRDAFRTLLEQLPVPVSTEEIARGGNTGVDFSDPVAIASAITAEIQTAKSTGEDISPADALARLQKGTAA